MKLIYYTKVCAPCNDQTYHYYETREAILRAGFEMDERFIGASEKWEKEASAFKSPLPILYCPEKNLYYSIGTGFNAEILKQFLSNLL